MSMTPLLHAPTPEDMRSVVYPTADGNPPPPAAAPPPIAPLPPAGNPNPAPSGPTSEQQDGYAYLRSVLDDYGLGELSDWAWGQIVAGSSPTMVLQELRKQPAFQRRFRVIFERQKLGLAPMSPAEVIAYEKQARQMMVAAGLPQGFYDDQSDFEGFMVGDVSLKELSDRVNQAKVWAYQTDAQTRAEMDRLYPGSSSLLTPEFSAAYFLDPQRALPLIQRQITAAHESGSAVRSGFGQLSRTEAEWLADLGIDPTQATDAFGKLVVAKELFGDLPGGIDEGTVTREQQLGAAFAGNADDQRLIENRRAGRVGQFQGGGGFSTDKQGFSGLGSAR